MNGDRLFYLMIVVIALIGVGLFAIPVKADEFALATIKAKKNVIRKASSKAKAPSRLQHGFTNIEWYRATNSSKAQPSTAVTGVLHDSRKTGRPKDTGNPPELIVGRVPLAYRCQSRARGTRHQYSYRLDSDGKGL